MGFLQVLRTIFINLKRFAVRLNASKSEFITNELIYCGRSISTQGWRFSSVHYSKLLQMPTPTTLAQLEQIVYSVNWLGETIPNSAKIRDHFQSLSVLIREKIKRTDRMKRKTDASVPLAPY